MKNTMVDLNNHLFEQLERLNDEELTDQEFEKEVKRAKAMERIAAEIIDNARVGLSVYQTMMETEETLILKTLRRLQNRKMRF